VSGTGLVKVVNGSPQTPASLLTNTDVAANANIALSKINLSTLLGSRNMSTTVVDTYNRGDTANTSQSLGSGNIVHMSLFTPLVDITANYITIISASQPASGTLKLGLYTFDEGTSIFSRLAEASSYTLNNAAAGPIKVALTSACPLSAGNRYAVAVAVSTTPTAFNVAALPSGTIVAILNLSPIVASTFTAQSNLNNTFTHTSANTPNYKIFARVSNT
jgi:hypothetical protein